ncbi:hypothetical protein NDU88_007561 [Pleurodeles waltl]|uniref:Uncharacterized protein n=1 Tax=Pleurodeles waltl TaxID=8319 RepID=A0AAV7PQB3_PLEWA|nr:hypothetical protein NDU88_007561 [Pleurodeles waltl]
MRIAAEQMDEQTFARQLDARKALLQPERDRSLIPVGSTRGHFFTLSGVPERFSSAIRVAFALGRLRKTRLG